MIAEIHVSPSPAGTPEVRYAHVEAAIDAVRPSGLRFEVGALGTTFEGFEGEPDAVWETLRSAHEASKGLGIYISRSQASFRVDQVFVAVVIVAVLSTALFVVIGGLARLASPWRYATTATEHSQPTHSERTRS